jgi:amino acid adenylation domain-containing protein
MYINTLPLVTTINDEEQTGIWLQQLQQQQSASRQYQYTPLSSILGWAQQHEALFDTLLIYENYPVAKVLSTQDWRLQVANIHVREQTNYPLSVEVGVGKEISIRLEYNTRLLNSFQTEQIRDHIKQVLLHMAANVHGSITDIHMLPAWEEKLLLETFQGKKAAMDPGKTVIDRFKQQVLQHPHAIAVKQAQKQLSYTALEERSNQVANFLIEKGIQKEALVVICMPRGIEMIAAILGCWKACAAYVPVDPNYPQQRISYIIEETEAAIVLNEDRQHDISAAPTTAPGSKVSEEQLAYIIYTSGSTGRPKGAMIEHAGMLNHLLAKITELEMDANTRIAQTAASTFDISVWQMMAALICGGTTIVYNDDVIYEPQKILSCFEQDAITIAELVPSYLNSVLEETPGAGLTALQFLLVTGEAVHPSTLQKWFQFYPGKRVVNAYGPTEASDDICHYHMSDVPDAYTIPIGKPIQNLSIQITDKKGRLCPIGIDGEISVTGVGVGRGYWKDAEKTQKSFKENIPGSYSRCYKTGDVGRWQPDGTILYLGRMDEQVKIRGYRVELGEIENALHEYPGIRQGAVVARENTNGEKQLFGYFVAETAISRSDLDNYLKERLPAYMVPAMLTQLTGLPVTPNGKLDKASLAAVTLHPSTEKASHAPQTETEKMLADIWQSILKIERIGIYDNVFELGAHSLLIIKAIAQIRKIAGLEIPVRVMFQFNNIHDQAKYVELTGSINSLPQNAGHQQIIEL